MTGQKDHAALLARLETYRHRQVKHAVSSGRSTAHAIANLSLIAVYEKARAAARRAGTALDISEAIAALSTGQPDTTWTPTAEAVNALPEPLRSYIHQLETRCDPSGELRELVIARDTIRALSQVADEQRAALSTEQPEGGRAQQDEFVPPGVQCALCKERAALVRDYASRLAKAEAALTSPVTGEPQGWQPIETAPKDARAIIGETWDGHVHPVWWNKTYPRWEWCGDGYHSGAAPRLVCWLPLPEPEPTAPTGDPHD